MTTTEQQLSRPPESQTGDGSWIVGIDGSDSAGHALEWATTHAAGRATEIHVVAAWQRPMPIDVPGAGLPPYEAGSVKASVEADARRIAAAAAETVDVPVRSLVAHGGPSAVLLDAAEHGSLLVVGNRGRGGFARLLLGSTSQQCATHSTVPTAVIPTSTRVVETKRILVGLDGSTNSHAALRWALSFAHLGTTVHVVGVWDASPLAVGSDQFFFPEAHAMAEERFHHLLDEALDAIDSGPGDVTRDFVCGQARTVLQAQATTNDLVVVGTRGHGAIGAALLGSVSSWLLHHVEVPVVVVPAPHRHRQD